MDGDFIKGSMESHGKLILKCDMDELRATDSHIHHKTDRDEMVCPACRAAKARQGNPYYSKQKLYIYKDSGVGYCHRCHTVYVPYFEPNPDKVLLTIPNFIPEDENNFTQIDTVPDIYNGGMDFYTTAPEISENLRGFLGRRRSDSVISHLDELKFKAYNDEELIVPFFWDGEPFFYQISYCHPKSLKYKTPPCKHKPIYVLNPGHSVVVICEGVFDAIACRELYPSCTIAAIIGSAVTPYQVWMLRKLLPSQIIVYLDDTELSLSIIDQLKGYPIADYCRLNYVESPNGEDPEEYLCRITGKVISKI